MDRSYDLGISKKKTTKFATNTKQEMMNGCIQQPNKKVHAMT